MPNRQTHQVAGALVGGLAGIYYVWENPDEPAWKKIMVVVGATGLGLLGGMVPDRFEPPRHPNHRRFFHSQINLGGQFTLLAIINRMGLSTESKTLLSAFFLGYVSHCLLDSTTPKGLPLI